jgi:hypothetical protein
MADQIKKAYLAWRQSGRSGMQYLQRLPMPRYLLLVSICKEAVDAKASVESEIDTQRIWRLDCSEPTPREFLVTLKMIN